MGTGYPEAFDRSSSKTWKPGMYLRRGNVPEKGAACCKNNHLALHLPPIFAPGRGDGDCDDIGDDAGDADVMMMVMVVVMVMLVLMVIYLMTVSCSHLTSLSWSKA